MSQDFRIYKPFKGKGSASQFQIRTKEVQKDDKKFNKVMLFLVMANEVPSDNDNAKFDWDNNVTALLNENDVGALLTVLDGYRENLGKGLYHQNPKGNTVIKLTKNTEKQNFFLEVSVQRDGVNTKVGHSISYGESIVLRTLLVEFIKRKFDW